MADDVNARLAEIERRLAALEAAGAQPAAVAPAVWVMPEWLRPLDESFQAGNPAAALTLADKLRADAYAASSVTQLEELREYLSRVPVAYPALGRVMSAIDRNLATISGSTRGPERRTDLRPFPAPAAEGSVPATGDGSGDAGED